MKRIKKAAAMLCGFAAAVILAAGALSAFAYDTVDIADRQDELTEDAIGLLADKVYAEAGETVLVGVQIVNNTGYTNIGITLGYDERLELIIDGANSADLVLGPASMGLAFSTSLNTDEHVIGYSSMGSRNCTEDGAIFSIQVTVPENATVGTKYPITLYAENLTDRLTKPLPFTVADGWIEVREPEVTTTTTTVTTTTATTTRTTTTARTTTVTSTTSTTTRATSTTARTTTTTARTTTESVTTTTAQTTSVTTTTGSTSTSKRETTTVTTIVTDPATNRTTKKTDRDPTHAVTTAGKGGSSGNKTTNAGTTSKTTSAKTGDAGVGTAVAAAALAAASAIVFGRKKQR